MATKKTKKKVVDGFTRSPKKSSLKSAEKSGKNTAKDETAKKISVEDAIKKPVTVSTEETKITVIEADNIEDTPVSPAEGLGNDSVAEPPVDEESTPQPVSAAEITVAVNNPVDEDAEDAEKDHTNDADIEALINDVALEDEDEDKNKNEDEKTKKKERTMKNKTPKKALPFRIISRILAVATAICLTILAVRVISTGALPAKYLWPGVGVAALFSLFFLFKAFRKKTHLKVLGILDFFGIILAAASIFGFLKVDELMRFLDNNLDTGQEYSIYSVIVSRKSNYNSLSDVKGQTFHSISDFVDTEKLEKAAKEQAGASIAYEDGITSLLKNTMDATTYIALLNSGTYEATLDTDENNTYSSNLKVIGEIKVPAEKKERNNNSNLTENSFLLYISGIDTRSGTMVDRSLSDVNIVMAVNPKTKNILMVAVPRDYYVQLHGTTGLPDKLTHAGSLGGIELSMSTIEDLLGISFSHYFRANFNAVINLVDAIGGITVYSDVNYNITAHTNNSCVFHPGNNDVNGACALAFARERYAYSSGDRHRGENQEQVIEKIFNKVTSSSTIISRYSDILNALSGSFETSLQTSDITSLVNMQLSNMSKWTITSYNLNGTTGMTYTYSYPSQQLSVMYPDESTIVTAKQKLQAVIDGTKEADYTDDTNK